MFNGLLPLLIAVGAWGWWLGPAHQQPLLWAPLPGAGLRLDTLSLLFLTLLLALPASPAPPTASGTTPRPRWIATLLTLGGPALVALAGETTGQIAGLALAALGRILAGAPGARLAWLAPVLLLPVAWSGAFDAHPLPGRPIPVLPEELVILALLAAAAGAGGWPFAGGTPATRSARDAWPTALYGTAALIPLLRSLGAGPWDAWGRLAVLTVGLLTLASAALAALAAPDHAAALRAGRRYLVAVVLIGLGSGNPVGVAGAVVWLAAGLAGLALSAARGLPRLVGLGALGGLPPTLGLAGLWLLLGATTTGGWLLATVALPVGGLLVVLALLRHSPETPGPAGIAAGLWAGALLLGGVAPLPWLDNVLRPALNTLAAGLPALAGVQEWPGVGLILVRANITLAVWPALGVAATLVLAGALVEVAARLPRRRAATTPPAPLVAPAPPAPLLPEAAAWADWLDPTRLLRHRRPLPPDNRDA
jgi:hypothetical protein